MRRRWYYLKQDMKAAAPLLPVLLFIFVLFLFLWGGRHRFAAALKTTFDTYGVQAAGAVIKQVCPALSASEEEEPLLTRLAGKNRLLAYMQEMKKEPEHGEDPAYERFLASAWERDQAERKQDASPGTAPPLTDEAPAGEVGENAAGEVIAAKPAGQTLITEKLADYDYLMNNFYNIHPTTTASREQMSAKRFMEMDFSLDPAQEGPQILIYHTHSQEEFADYPQNPDATIVGVGAYLAELLQEKGFRVIHDTDVYDLQNGKLDRSKAYTYALDGISGILQKNPSIEVVLDIHRDGVKAGTHLVKEIEGRPTAQIMFFNGMSQTPEGPIEYLPNPNRESNLAFSFQMQLAAAEKYPGFTRKIYLKGLRYNEHVRARSALVEVGAQTNTYEEAKNAMIPLADILAKVLGGE